MDLEERDPNTAAARRERARRLRLGSDIQITPSRGGHSSDRPILDITRPRLRLFARPGEFPRAETSGSPTPD